jgi:ankyrin repeat protein
MKNSLFLLVFVSFGFSTAQQNIFLSRDFWKTDPSVAELKKKINAGNDPVALNKNGFDAMVYGLLENTNTASLKYLLSLEGNEIDKITHDDRVYLHWAAYKGNLDMINYLFSKGASVEVYDENGHSPLTFAAATGQKDAAVYQLFEKQGVLLSTHVNANGENVLHAASRRISTAGDLNFFVKMGADLKLLDKEGNSLLQKAVSRNNLDLVKLLEVDSFDLEHKNSDGNTTLLIAAMKSKDLDILEYLVAQGADRNATTEFGETAHDLALENEFLANKSNQLEFLKP